MRCGRCRCSRLRRSPRVVAWRLLTSELRHSKTSGLCLLLWPLLPPAAVAAATWLGTACRLQINRSSTATQNLFLHPPPTFVSYTPSSTCNQLLLIAPVLSPTLFCSLVLRPACFTMKRFNLAAVVGAAFAVPALAFPDGKSFLLSHGGTTKENRSMQTRNGLGTALPVMPSIQLKLGSSHRPS
ncbi:hypothetical protein BCR34DRAFT_309752 [Clohesyomyces aquaticus]|uniref:Uncharacterized protein n=1 Tax=Clohesyomyces aquaticus TaxID=1231657 RepID=A0A1Y1ZP01_9PLEO|nr:hypothetical protein BCR34DRAFT_309752 [Clohesyomyces aquaticus]